MEKRHVCTYVARPLLEEIRSQEFEEKEKVDFSSVLVLSKIALVHRSGSISTPEKVGERKEESTHVLYLALSYILSHE